MDIETTPEAISVADLKKKQKKADKKLISLERVRLAFERLHLAWIKFAVTLTAFGFTIDRILESKMKDGRPPVLGFIDGRGIGLFMVATGFVGLVLATFQHIQCMATLRKRYDKMPASVSLRIGFIILAFSFLVLLVVLFRL